MGAEAEDVEGTPEVKKKKKKKKVKGAGEEEEEDDGKQGETAVDKVKDATAREKRRFGQRRKPEADEQYSLTRGVDLHGVSTVINADMPVTVRDYVHRVGRCARGGASGTALTLCILGSTEELVLEQ